MKAKICGISDLKTLRHITNHTNPPSFIGFIVNYPKSKRYVRLKDLGNLLKINKKKINYVAVLVKPNDKFLKKIRNLNFDYYQLYDVNPQRTFEIKKKYKIKIISAITIKNLMDLEAFKDYLNISDIILFDSKGYEKSLSFDHSLLKNVPNSITKMVAGNIQFDDALDKYKEIADIIDLSGSLETSGKKDTLKIDIFLKNLKKINE